MMKNPRAAVLAAVVVMIGLGLWLGGGNHQPSSVASGPAPQRAATGAPPVRGPSAPTPPAPVVTAPGPSSSVTSAPMVAVPMSNADGTLSAAPQVRATPPPLPAPPQPKAVQTAPPPPPGADDPATLAAAAIDVDKVNLMLRDYRTLMGGNPVGTNAEIMKSIMGGNPKGATLGPPDGLKLNSNGELTDRWGTPFFFHQMSATDMQIRSAGPDRIMWTADDVFMR